MPAAVWDADVIPVAASVEFAGVLMRISGCQFLLDQKRCRRAQPRDHEIPRVIAKVACIGANGLRLR